MALTVGNVSSAGGLTTGTGTLTVASHVHDGSYLVVIAAIGYAENAYTISCTFDGGSVPIVSDGGYTSNRGVTAFGVAVGAKTGDVVVTFATTVEVATRVAAVSVSGTGVTATTSPTPVESNSSSTSFTQSITATTAAGELVIDGWALRDTTSVDNVSASVGANQTSLMNAKSGASSGGHVWGLVSSQAGADGGVMTWDVSNPNPDACFYMGVAVVLQEGGGGSGGGAAVAAYAQQ